jgi:hypothetical protein
VPLSPPPGETTVGDAARTLLAAPTAPPVRPAAALPALGVRGGATGGKGRVISTVSPLSL